jgi:hypothetical protein
VGAADAVADADAGDTTHAVAAHGMHVHAHASSRRLMQLPKGIHQGESTVAEDVSKCLSQMTL